MSITRAEQKPEDCWRLESIYADVQVWEADLKKLQDLVPTLQEYKGRLAEGPETLLACLASMYACDRLEDRVGTWAFLKLSEDGSDSASQARQGRYTSVSVGLQTASSWFQPEFMALPREMVDQVMKDPRFADYHIALSRFLRYRPHTLGEAEERLLALRGESSQTARKTFGALTDVDLDFGTIETPEGPKPLSQSSFVAFLQQGNRDLREKAWTQFYGVFGQHKNTLANLYQGSIHEDVFRARARNFPSSLEAALFPDEVDISVYENLISTVRENLPILHKYYRIRKDRLGIDQTQVWDTRANLFPEQKSRHTFDEAVGLVLEALHPLGAEYVETLGKGLKSGWVDRYENKGKRSGAFSAGGFDTEPFILMNYKENVLGDVFTLAHEAGHSMHSWYSVRNNPYPHHRYSIFEAEVASTFNEELLFRHLSARPGDKELELYLTNKHVEDIVATLFRQTMFAEYELVCHRRAEAGQSLSLDDLRTEYRKLLEAWFGAEVNIHELADLEGLRIPHFYRAFYVYKYATGLSAAMALAKKVCEGDAKDRNEYLSFLKAGGSSFPIQSLAKAGVDMSSPAPIKSAMEVFTTLVNKLDTRP